MISKKMLISSISVIGSAVTVTAVATPITLTSSHTQSASTDVDDNDNNESELPGIDATNPVTPDDSDNNPSAGEQTTSNSVTLASTDTFVANLDDDKKIDNDIASDDATLNAYLNVVFITDGVASHLTNKYDDYVTLTYVSGSADYETMTFEVIATLDEGYTFSGSNTTSKIITVTIPVDDIDQILYDAYTPTTDTYLGYLSYVQVSNSEMLDSYLYQQDSHGELTDYLLNYSSYSNVSVTYLTGSASYDDNTFTLVATPISGHAWSDGSTNSKEITVVLTSIDKNLWDSTIGTTLSFSYETSVTSDAELEASISTLFTDSTALDYLVSDVSIANVEITYVSESANLSDLTFEIVATPTNNHAWDDGTTDSKTLIVSLTNVTAKNIATIPLGLKFSINAAAKFVNGDFNNKTLNFSWATLRSIGYEGLQQFYKYIDYVGQYTYRYGMVTIAKSADGSSRNRVYTMSIMVKPKSGYTWTDGQTYYRYVTLHYFKTFMNFDGYSETKQANVGNVAVEVTDGTINHWISNFIYAPTDQDRADTTTVATKVYDDLYETLSKIYWVDSKESFKFAWITEGSNWDNNMTYGVYTFKIAPKNAPEKVKTITGYLFTASQGQLSFIQDHLYIN